ncbi:MAG: insulinase family protein [Pirellulales bacterium]|nr:insulinase family protein [Pirellulales bacterium]
MACVGILVPFLFCCSNVLSQDVPYERYTLPNGMTVILHEDHSVPVAGINIWYYVGSKDEPDRRSGFAHLFEHLMFMGTDRVPGGEFDNIMEAGGGFNNASTSEDRTNYYSTGPSELLPTLLWLDADRLDGIGRAMTKEKLDKQRSVVLNERRQTSENRPYGRADLMIPSLMYPKSHPYHHTVIGSHEDIESATVGDVKNFFATYYVPSNASLVVAGDFKKETIKPLIDKLFGTLPRGNDVVHPKAAPVALSEVKRLTMTDKVQFARSTMVYHSPASFADGDAEMDLAAAILSDGISSRLYQRLVYEKELAVDVTAYQASMLLGSLFYIEVTSRPGSDLDVIEGETDRVVAEFTAQGPTEKELERLKAKLEFRMISRLQSIMGKADQLNTYQFFFGEPNSFQRDLDRYRTATPRRVQDWVARVLTPNARLILRVIPEMEAPDVSPLENRPALGAARSFTVPIPETFTLPNGITVHLWERHELPLVEMLMLFPAGTTNDPAGKAGLATLTADMLDEGAGSRGAVAFADAMDALGATFSAHAGRDMTTVSIAALASKFDAALELGADAVLRPQFDEKEWDRVHKLHVQQILRALDRPTYVAQTVAMRHFFGKDHPYSRPESGTPESAQAIQLDDVRKFYARAYRSSNAVILIAGDLTVDKARESLEKTFGAWPEVAGVVPFDPPNYDPHPNPLFRLAIVDRPNAVQTVIHFMAPGPVYSDPNRPKFQLFNIILGGSFTSRLNQNLREEHGYTYGARSHYAMDPRVGYFSAESSVQTDVTGAAVGEFLKEFARIRAGDITDMEAGKARSARRISLVSAFEGLGGILRTSATLIRNHRPFSDLGEELAAIERLTATDLNDMAHDAVPVERGLLVLVGDTKRIVPQLKGLNLPAPIELQAAEDDSGD